MYVNHEWVSYFCRSECSTLGSYDVLIGMDWLEAHIVKLGFYNNTFECIDEEGNLRVVKGISKVISVRQISAMQLKNLCRKGF